MNFRHCVLACSVLLTPAIALGEAQSALARWRPTINLQTGLASTFQLTLGGTFGKGPAFQNRAIVDFRSVLKKGDAITVNGWMTVDTRSRNRDWTLGIGYRLPAFRVGSGSLVLTTGWQRWLFPSVLTGARDHLVAVNGVYRDKWKLPVTFTADNWTLVSSPLRKGNLTHMQFNVAHTLLEVSGASLVLRHGPSTTYSHNFYNRPGWRVLRYGGSLTLETKPFSLEGAVRQQSGIAPHVADNTYWSVILSRRF